MTPPSNPAERPRGYTLPVWVAAAARAAVGQLLGDAFTAEQPLRLDPGAPEGPPTLVPVVAAAPLGEGRALAVARCEPGDGLDPTRGPVAWEAARWRTLEPEPGPAPRGADSSLLEPQAGAGVGVRCRTRQPRHPGLPPLALDTRP